jgi:hypothetical protein
VELNQVTAAFRSFEQEVGIPVHFLDHLLVETNDWAFVIKLHALLETVVTHHLTSSTDSRLANEFSRLNLNARVGKLSFVRALNLLSNEEVRFIKMVSEIRNDLVHDVHGFKFTFESHFREMQEIDRKSYVTNVSWWVDGEQREQFERAVLNGPRGTLWLTAVNILSGVATESLRRKIVAGLQNAARGAEAETS